MGHKLPAAIIPDAIAADVIPGKFDRLDCLDGEVVLRNEQIACDCIDRAAEVPSWLAFGNSRDMRIFRIRKEKKWNADEEKQGEALHDRSALKKCLPRIRGLKIWMQVFILTRFCTFFGSNVREQKNKASGLQKVQSRVLTQFRLNRFLQLSRILFHFYTWHSFPGHPMREWRNW